VARGLREFISRNVHIEPLAALEYLLARGWRTGARDPLNATRTALAHLATMGELERVKRGVYRPAAGERADEPCDEHAAIAC
jgi:hypothetical protein